MGNPNPNTSGLTPFQPGQSGNPAGKPKGAKHLSTRIQEMLNDDEFTANMVGSDGKSIQFKGQPMEAIVRTAMLKAMSGDKKWAEWLAKYGYGLKQVLEFQNNPVNDILAKYGLTTAEQEPIEETTESKDETTTEAPSADDNKPDDKDNVTGEKESNAGENTEAS